MKFTIFSWIGFCLLLAVLLSISVAPSHAAGEYFVRKNSSGTQQGTSVTPYNFAQPPAQSSSQQTTPESPLKNPPVRQPVPALPKTPAVVQVPQQVQSNTQTVTSLPPVLPVRVCTAADQKAIVDIEKKTNNLTARMASSRNPGTDPNNSATQAASKEMMNFYSNPESMEKLMELYVRCAEYVMQRAPQ
jgi:hypothetical protein